MKELQLQPRLAHLAQIVPKGARLADIGTDHGYLPVWLIQQGQIDHAIAADIALEPLDHARHTAQECGVNNVDFRLCDGLVGIRPEESDYIVIAGMGGDTIVSILQKAPWTKCGIKLLLQPMTKVEMLRGWLADNGYNFTQESLVLDKDFLYPVMEVCGGERSTLSETEKYSGLLLENDPLYTHYLTRQITRLQKAIDGLNRSNGATSHDRACLLAGIRNELEEKRNAL